MRRHRFVIATLAIFVVAVCLTVFSVLRSKQDHVAVARGNVCQHNLAFLYRALRSYHDKYGKFPPAYIADKYGTPMHSWRVLVLETLGEPQSADVYRAYNFDEPWNGPSNRKLSDRMPNFFACPNNGCKERDRRRLANYVVITSSDAVFRGVNSLSMQQIVDVHTETIILAETVPGVPWLEPKDLDSNTMTFNVDDQSRPSISSLDPRGAGIVLLDGRVDRLTKNIDSIRVKDMISVQMKANFKDARNK